MVAEARDFAADLRKQRGLAQQLGFTGTPSWVVGGQTLVGAVGTEALQQAIDAAARKTGG